MTDLREWLDMYRKLRSILRLTEEEINDVLVGVMDSTNCYFSIETLKRGLLPEQYETLAENFRGGVLTPDTQFGILKNANDKYIIYRRDPKINFKDGEKEEPACKNIFMELYPHKTPVEFMLGIAGETAASKIDGLEDRLSNFGKLAILTTLLDAVNSCERSISLRDNTMARLEHLGENNIENDLKMIFKAAEMLGTEFTPEEVQRMVGRSKVEKGEGYRVVQKKSYQMLNVTGTQSYPLNFTKGEPKVYVNQMLYALLRQSETNAIPSYPYINLSKEDAEKLLNYALSSVEEFIRRNKKEDRIEDFIKLNENVKQIVSETPEKGSEALLDVLAMTECVFSDEDIRRLLPKEKCQEFDGNVKERYLSNTFKISKNEDGTFGIVRNSHSLGGLPIISFDASELDPQATRKTSEVVIEKQFANRLNGIRGQNSRKLLQSTLEMLDRYAAMENNKEYIMSELGKLDEKSLEEARELIIAVMVMAQPVLIPNENMPEEFKHLFSNAAKYIVTRNKGGQFYLNDVDSNAAPVKFNADSLNLTKNLPLFISAMRQHKESGEIQSTGYLTYDGVQTVLDAAIAGFEKIKEREDIKIKPDVVAAVETFARTLGVAQEKTTVIKKVTELDPSKQTILNLDQSDVGKNIGDD